MKLLVEIMSQRNIAVIAALLKAIRFYFASNIGGGGAGRRGQLPPRIPPPVRT